MGMTRVSATFRGSLCVGANDLAHQRASETSELNNTGCRPLGVVTCSALGSQKTLKERVWVLIPLLFTACQKRADGLEVPFGASNAEIFIIDLVIGIVLFLH